MALLLLSQGVPMILAGDFNSTPPAFPHAAADERRRNAIAALTDDGQFHSRPTHAPAAADFTFSALCNAYRRE